ncbi:MAG: asparagine synthase (glutamine-hydrolyzing), partial [Gammaproteobacteria bacterium]
MCGIVCWVKANGKVHSDLPLLKKMTRALNHRGPDGEGFHIDGSVALGHTRLSIVDIANGHQPMVKNTIAVTYNGEIYNFRELRTELEAVGYSFSTNCDTEVLIHGWSHWGDTLVTKLRGMFAFVIWDAATQDLFIARDRFGIKP